MIDAQPIVTSGFAGVKDVPLRFNGNEMKKHRNSRQPVRVRAVALTVLDDNKLILASPLVPDDRLVHAVDVLKRVVDFLLEQRKPMLAAVFCDSVLKYSNGCAPFGFGSYAVSQV